MMALIDQVRIARRFQKSVRIDTDINASQALEGFICTRTTTNVLKTMAKHIEESGHCAFTWTGPYGSGKSSLVVSLSALLDGNPILRNRAERIFGHGLSNTLREALPIGTKGWQILPVVGRRTNPVSEIGSAVLSSGLVNEKPEDGWNENNLILTLAGIAESNKSKHGGLIIFIDEMGKFLESAAKDGTDIYIFQQLAEIASRSNNRLIIIGILHQVFEEYAHRLAHEMRDEWSKVQGRFIDLSIDTVGEEQIDLISRAVECDRSQKKLSPISTSVANLTRRKQKGDSLYLAKMLDKCWPLHPVVACLLGPISRRRFGQNQRSIFGFLNSSEPHGFQEFLRHANDDELYGSDRLWDYLRANLEPSIMASPDGHRWALAVEGIERCESISDNTLHIKLLKTIAVVDMFKERSGLVASFDLLQTCFSENPEILRSALQDLNKWSLTINKKFLDAYSIFAGSDFDIDRAIHTAIDEIDEIDFKLLKSLLALQPILAKRHYHNTGTLRWFDVDLLAVKNLTELDKDSKVTNGEIGRFLLAIPTEGENREHAEKSCRKAAQCSNGLDIVVGISKMSWTVVPLARELIALNKISNDHPDLEGDSVARREVSSRLASLQALLEAEIYKAFDSALWFRKHKKRKQLRQVDLNILASEIVDDRFSNTPHLYNELLNRQKPSSSAIAAQNILLRRMVLNEGEPRLGIRGFPAEGGLFASILDFTGLYAQVDGKWRFVSPATITPDTCKLEPMWKEAAYYVKNQAHRIVNVSELFDLWRNPPYGLKDGLLPILSVAFILSQREKLAIYREEIFQAQFSDLDVEYLAKDPSSIQIRWMELSKVARRLLSSMTDIVRDFNCNNSLAYHEPIDVARGLVEIYDNLPQWTKRTMQLSSNALRIRELFKRAYDPNKFLFDDIPKIHGEDFDFSCEEDIQMLVKSIKDGLNELSLAYQTMLHRLRDVMLSELQVPNTSTQSMKELRDRAENIKELAGDFRIEAFIGRLSEFNGSDESFEAIAGLAANKPPKLWVDLDVDSATIEIAEMSQKFLRAETFARVKGRPEKRQSLAVVVGVGGRPAPLFEEFEIADSDLAAVNDLISRVAAALDEADINRRNIILAALAELIARYIQESPRIEANKNDKLVN